jgi:hypothetical protein
MMNSEKHHHEEDENKVISQTSSHVFNLNTCHPYYTKDKDDEFFCKSTSVHSYCLLGVYKSVASSRLCIAQNSC